MAIPQLIGSRGGDPDAPNLLYQAGWRYGSRSDYTIYDCPNNPVQFIDINWKRYSWLRHWLVLRKWRPEIGMVADYEYPHQKSTMLRQVAHVRWLGIRPMVCPKFPGAVKDIPDDCLIAISVPTDYAGYLPDHKEIETRDLHLLGGHPDQFIWLMRERYQGIRVYSIDCSVIFLKAQFGAFWNPVKNDWQYTAKNEYTTHDLTVMSAKNITSYLRNPPRGKKWNLKRSQAIFQSQLGF